MKYLIKVQGKKQKTAHLWDGTDTLCRMFSTGGLNPSKYEITDHKGERGICFMCNTVKMRDEMMVGVDGVRVMPD